MEHVRSLLDLLRDVGVMLKLRKCVRSSGTINNLRNIIRQGKLGLATHSREAIEGMQPPISITKLRSFLGFCTVFSRRSDPNFARVEAPLHMKLQNDQPFKFGELNDEELSTLESFRTKMVNQSVPILPRRGGQSTVYTDASNKQVRRVLLQEKSDSATKRIGYWSRSLNYTERRYNNAHRGCL